MEETEMPKEEAAAPPPSDNAGAPATTPAATPAPLQPMQGVSDLEPFWATAAEGVEVVDELVVRAQAQQVDLVLRRRGLVEPGSLAHQVPLEVAGALPLLLTPIPHEDKDLAGVGLLEGVDVCPADSALGGVGQGAFCHSRGGASS